MHHQDRVFHIRQGPDGQETNLGPPGSCPFTTFFGVQIQFPYYNRRQKKGIPLFYPLYWGPTVVDFPTGSQCPRNGHAQLSLSLFLSLSLSLPHVLLFVYISSLFLSLSLFLALLDLVSLCYVHIVLFVC